MSVEENKAIVRRFYDEFVNGNNTAVAEELITAECPLYMGSNLMGTGPEGYRRTLAMLRSDFPDLHSTIEEVIAEGDKIAERVTTSGTHQARGIYGCRSHWQADIDDGNLHLQDIRGEGRGKQSHTGRARHDAADQCHTRARPVGRGQPHLTRWSCWVPFVRPAHFCNDRNFWCRSASLVQEGLLVQGRLNFQYAGQLLYCARIAPRECYCAPAWVGKGVGSG